jgi:hypothetical protein
MIYRDHQLESVSHCIIIITSRVSRSLIQFKTINRSQQESLINGFDPSPFQTIAKSNEIVNLPTTKRCSHHRSLFQAIGEALRKPKYEILSRHDDHLSQTARVSFLMPHAGQLSHKLSTQIMRHHRSIVVADTDFFSLLFSRKQFA